MILAEWFEPLRSSRSFRGSVLLRYFRLFWRALDVQAEARTNHGRSSNMCTEKWHQTEPQNTAMRCLTTSLSRRMLKTRCRPWWSKFLENAIGTVECLQYTKHIRTCHNLFQQCAEEAEGCEVSCIEKTDDLTRSSQEEAFLGCYWANQVRVVISIQPLIQDVNKLQIIYLCFQIFKRGAARGVDSWAPGGGLLCDPRRHPESY